MSHTSSSLSKTRKKKKNKTF